MGDAEEITQPAQPAPKPSLLPIDPGIKREFDSLHQVLGLMVVNLDKRLDAIEHNSKLTREQVQSLGGSIEQLRKDVHELSRRLDMLEEATAKRSEFHELRGMVTKLQLRLDLLEKRQASGE